jgi:hypothetical protein
MRPPRPRSRRPEWPQDGPARGFLAGAQTDIEHAVDGGGVNADADLAGTWLRVWYLLVA